MKKLSGQLHLWLGLLSGIIVFIVSLTGCIYVFHEEISSLFPKDREIAQKLEKIDPAGRLLMQPSAIVKKIQQQSSKDSIIIKPAMIRYINGEPSLLLAEEKGINERSWYTFNPYTGELLDHKFETPYGTYRVHNGIMEAKNLRGFEFFPFILQGHQDLWLPTNIGRPMVRYGTLVFVVLLITGIVLWWPKNKAAAKQRYWFRWKDTTKWRRKNYDLHNINGFYMFLFLLIISFTGLCIGLEWMSGSVYTLLGGKEKEVFKSSPPAIEHPIDQLYNLDNILKNDIAAHPDAIRRSMYWSYPALSDKEATIMTVTYTKDDDFRVYFDKYTQHRLGQEADHDHDGQKDLAEKVEELYLPIHEGSIGGIATKSLAFIASFICASLPITGFSIWWGRRNKKSKKK